jgi:hypothetical protein
VRDARAHAYNGDNTNRRAANIVTRSTCLNRSWPRHLFGSYAPPNIP